MSEGNFNEPILITGCARSGTSLTAGIVHLCGAWGGEMRGPNQYNPKGMFENAAIVNELSKPYLSSIGADPMGQKPLPDTENVPIVQDWHLAVLMRLKDQGYNGEKWFYKGAKMCLFWPVWHAAFPHAKWIIVRRDANQIADSCMRTPFMRAHRHREGWLEWVREHEIRFEQMRENIPNLIEVWPSGILEDYTLASRMTDWCGLKWNASAVQEFVEPQYWNRKE